MRLLLAVGSDFLGQWLPACLAAAMPGVSIRMVGILWGDGIEARRAGIPYRHQSIFHPSKTSKQALQHLLKSEFSSFKPTAAVYLTAESIMGQAIISEAAKNNIPAIGLQTFFQRGSVLVHKAGKDWWKMLLALPISTKISSHSSKRTNNLELNPSIHHRLTEKKYCSFQHRIWLNRSERAIRSLLHSGHERPSEGFSRFLELPFFRGRHLLDSAWPQVPAFFPSPPVLVALHRPILAPGEPDWVALIRFALQATPREIPIVLRPHPGESSRALPDGLVSLLKDRKIYVSRASTPPNLHDLIASSRLVITLNSAVGFEALMQGLPVATITPGYYTRSGMAFSINPQHPEDLRQLIEQNTLPQPDIEIVSTFVQLLEEISSAAIPSPSSGIVPATALAQRIMDCLAR